MVNDAHLDERFSDNPLVHGDPGVRFYAGVPLATSAGHALGTLCVIDRVPRKLTPEQLEILTVLGRQAATQAELRARTRELQNARNRLSDVLESASDLIQSVSPEGALTYANRAWKERLGYAEADMPAPAT